MLCTHPCASPFQLPQHQLPGTFLTVEDIPCLGCPSCSIFQPPAALTLNNSSTLKDSAPPGYHLLQEALPDSPAGFVHPCLHWSVILCLHSCLLHQIGISSRAGPRSESFLCARHRPAESPAPPGAGGTGDVPPLSTCPSRCLFSTAALWSPRFRSFRPAFCKPHPEFFDDDGSLGRVTVDPGQGPEGRHWSGGFWERWLLVRGVGGGPATTSHCLLCKCPFYLSLSFSSCLGCFQPWSCLPARNSGRLAI